MRKSSSSRVRGQSASLPLGQVVFAQRQQMNIHRVWRGNGICPSTPRMAIWRCQELAHVGVRRSPLTPRRVERRQGARFWNTTTSTSKPGS